MQMAHRWQPHFFHWFSVKPTQGKHCAKANHNTTWKTYKHNITQCKPTKQNAQIPQLQFSVIFKDIKLFTISNLEASLPLCNKYKT